MLHKVWIGSKQTDLQVFVGTMTQFGERTGNLCCMDVIVVAANAREASIFVAMKYPKWELQSLTNLSVLPWFNAITLDPDCLEVAELQEFLIEHIVEVPVEDDI